MALEYRKFCQLGEISFVKSRKDSQDSTNSKLSSQNSPRIKLKGVMKMNGGQSSNSIQTEGKKYLLVYLEGNECQDFSSKI